jgi:hypothetical protein
MLFNKFSGLEEIVDATLSKEAVSDRYQLTGTFIKRQKYVAEKAKSISIRYHCT